MKFQATRIMIGLEIVSLVTTTLLGGCAGTSKELPTGTGSTKSAHSVNLTWTDSQSSDVSGYNVYRADYNNSCGPFTKINAVLHTSTSYTDDELVGGISYCYATTAVNLSNEESAYSNIVSNVKIPVP